MSSAADFEDELFQDLISDFLDESMKQISSLNDHFLEFEEALDSGDAETLDAAENYDALNEVFRAAHSMKGASAMLGIVGVNALTHKLENLLSAIRSSTVPLSRAALEILFRGLDRLEEILDHVAKTRTAKGRPEDSEFLDWLSTSIDELAAQGPAPTPQAAADSATARAASSAPAEKDAAMVPESQFGDQDDEDMDAPQSSASDLESELTPEMASSSLTPSPTPSESQQEAEMESDAEVEPNTPNDPNEAAATNEDFVTESNTEQEQTEKPKKADKRVAPPPPPPVEEDFGFDVRKYLTLYLDETDEEIEHLNQALLILERQPGDKEALNEVFRMAHRIKGSSTAMGFEGVSRLTHHLESLFDDLRGETRELDEPLMNLIFHCVDELRDFHLQYRATGEPSVNLDSLAQAVLSVLEGNAPPAIERMPSASNESAPQETAPKAVPAPAKSPSPSSDSKPDYPPTWTFPEGREGYRIVIDFHAGISFSDLKAELIQTKLSSRGEIHLTEPTLGDGSALTRFVVYIESTSEQAELESVANIDGVAHIDIQYFSIDESGTYAGSFGPPAEVVDEEPPAPAPVPTPAAAVPVSKQPEPVVPVALTSAPPAPPEPQEISREVEPINVPYADTKAPAKEVPVEPAAVSAAPPPKAKKPSRPQAPPPASGAAAAADLAARDGKDAGTSSARPSETLRVEIERLDHLMNLAGELVINKARFVQIAGGMHQIFGNNKNAIYASREISSRLDDMSQTLQKTRRGERSNLEIDQLAKNVDDLQNSFQIIMNELDRIQSGRNQFHTMEEAIHQLTRIAEGIQKSVMDTRMVPIEPLFARFKRVVRDVARSINKEVVLVISGEKTELDKRMIDELGDPLIHMVRNAVDHGLETPEEREAAGKPRHGTVRLEASHRGNSVVILVSDDGRGIDANRVRNKIIEQGLMGEAEANLLADHEVVNFIFHPGLSTAAQVTDISGRGVGMDIVKSKIDELNGLIEVRTEPGEGTVFSIRLPLTLAIMPSLLTRTFGEVYAIPLENVEEIVNVHCRDVNMVHGKSTIRVRSRVISLACLDDAFTWNGARRPSRGQHITKLREEGKDLTVVILQSGITRIGLVVDDLIGEDDIVIKSLAENFSNVRGLAGASILGNGRVSLILDVEAVLELISQPLPKVPA